MSRCSTVFPSLLLALFPILFLAAGCDSSARSDAPEDRPAPVLMISIDGYRHDYFERADTPVLDRLMEEGLAAESLVHVFPTKTFPTHYSMATGRYAENTGVVANSMWDPRRQARFSLGDRDSVSDGYWYDAEPIWVTAENQGRRSATYFWPGTEARINGVRPTWWKPYSARTPHDERIERVLEWLDKPADEGPSLVSLYFSRVDSLGHRHGPDAEEIDEAIASMDADLAELVDGLEARGLLGEMHILVVSDHGMTEIDAERTILLDDYLDLGRVRVSDWGPAAQIWAEDMDAEEIVEALQGAHPRMRVWKRDDIPERYGFRDHRRIADVLAEADAGWMISNKPHMAADRRYRLRGMHGWDPIHDEMGGIFLAHGPVFEPGDRMGRLESVHVYELIARLLGLEPAENDGSIHAFAGYAGLDGLDPDLSPEPPPALYGDRDRPDGRAISPARALEEVESLEGDRLAVEGRITRVCQRRGCWAMLADDEAEIRVYAREHSFALPPDLSGHARAHGTLERLVTEDGEEIRLVTDSIRVHSQGP